MKLFKIFILISFVFIFSSCSNNSYIKPTNYIKITDKNNAKIFHGIVKASLSTLLSFQSEGKIIFLPYTKGDFIKKGQVIARLDGELYKIKKNEELSKLQEATINYNKQKNYYNRMDILHKQGAISENDWENAYFELQAIEKQIAVQKEKINYLDKEISYNIISAPYDGYISQKISDIGSYAKIGQPIVEIISSKGFQVEIMVSENIINDFYLNKEVDVKILEKNYKGKISHISKSSLNSGGFLIKINILNADNIKEGMSADVKISSLKNYFLIPLRCVFEENNSKYVYKIVDINNNTGTIKKEKIETGAIINQEIEVTKGINYSDLIICEEINNYKEFKNVGL